MFPSFSIVIPTYRRSAVLKRTLPSYLAAGAEEVVLVDDASGPSHAEEIAQLAELPGVRIITVPFHAGQAAAKNQGARSVRSEWVVFGEDDVWFTPEYARGLIAHATQSSAAVAAGSVPLVHPSLLESPDRVIAATIRSKPMRDPRPDRFIGTRWPINGLESGDVVTPLITACAAVHRSVFERVEFDSRYTGNAFREETDFFFKCIEAGLTTIYCPHVSCGHVRTHSRSNPGGSWTTGRTRYAADMITNNWRFIRAHRETLERAGVARGALDRAALQLRFMLGLLARVRPTRA